MIPKLHSGHMELAVVDLIGYRRHTVVPNVSWGLGLNHECDMLVLDDSNRLTEIEIKISKSDLKADLKKWHQHNSKIITRLVFAIPYSLIDEVMTLLPPNVGIITVEWNQYSGKYEARWYRMSKHRKAIQEVSNEKIRKLLELGCMRIWSLKRALNNKIK